MYKIGIISDTHGLLRPEVIGKLQGCDQILHAGDIHKQSILDALERIAPVLAVRGNNDKEWAEYIPTSFCANVCGLNVFMVHNKKEIPENLEGIDLVVYGHSHKYEEKQKNEIVYLNPGSCGPRRFHQEITFAMVYTDSDKHFRIEKVLVPHREQNLRENRELEADIRSVISVVMRDVDAGKTVRQIADRHKIPEELAEQITRMYLTHPGIGVEGIFGKI